MLLVIDVGNTNIVFGVYDGEKLLGDWRMSTNAQRTADESGMFVIDIMREAGINYKTIDGVAISSVVPNVMYSIEHMIRKYFKIEPMTIGPGVKTGINIKYDNPKEVGADRIVNAVAAHDMFNMPIVIIDFGTATTFCAVGAKGDYFGGSIMPGVKIAADSLFEKAAKLPRVELSKPSNVICKNTIQSMQSGIIYGYIGAVDYIVNKMKQEMIKLGEKEPYIIATGGLSKLVASESTTIQEVCPFLTLEGLRIIYEKNM